MPTHEPQPVLTLESFDSKNPPDIHRRALADAIIESSEDAIISKTLDGIIRSWNASATRLFAYDSNEAVGQSILMLIPERLRYEENRILERLKAGERVEHFETRRLRKDGTEVPVSLTISPIRNARGEVIGASKIVRDMTDRLNIEAQLRDHTRNLMRKTHALSQLNEWSSRLWSRHELQPGLQEIIEAVIGLLGAQKGNLQLREADETLTMAAQRGFDHVFLNGFRSFAATPASACGRALEAREMIFIEDIENDAKYESLRPLAREAGYRAIASLPLIAGNDTILGVISCHFTKPHRPHEDEIATLRLYLRQACDFIQRCNTEKRLRDKEESLLIADRRKDEFLALLAHELRNPLAPIRYALTAQKHVAITVEQRQRTDAVIERQVAHMSRLLDDLLDVSRITRGRLQLKKSATDLTSILNAAIEAARPHMDARHHVLQVDLTEEPVQLDADHVRLVQVFSNLLINAAKYTDEGGRIDIAVRMDDTDVCVAVRDNGIGIPDDVLPRIFSIFTRAKNAEMRAEGGLGVGLSLVQGLVELHGGRVVARSEGVGKGSEFTIHLPLPKTRRIEADPVPESAALTGIVTK